MASTIETGNARRAGVHSDEGSGWLTFAGTMIALVGALNVIYGIAAIDDSKFFTPNATYVISDNLHTWGWVMLIIGAVQILTAIGIWSGSRAAVWVGVTFAALNAVVQMIFIAGSPWLSLAIFGVDILVIYGLLAYGTPESER